ncbi:hypothetical protein HJFPF1_06718 [Paramyrothecium foliicola]|nr:hypothetical protein HJFPF1_06718 [Paramyrothecium foliicola]
MAPTTAKANYKSYEAQARMVRAIVAAHPEVKWNYKEIAACYGSDMSEHALNHRWRHLKAQATIIRKARDQHLDMKDLVVDEKQLPATQDAVKNGNIAKYFGQSTADGIQFQFRTIKKDADLLRQTELAGGDVANCLDIGGGTSVTNTPSKPTPTRPRGGGRSTGKAKRKQQTTFIKRTSSDEEDQDGDDNEDWSDKDESPSKRTKTGALPGQKNGTPSRRAAVKAVATIADSSAQLQDSEAAASDYEAAPSPVRHLPAPPSTVAPTSIFGNVTPRAMIPFNTMGEDAFLGMDLGTNGYPASGFDDDGYF